MAVAGGALATACGGAPPEPEAPVWTSGGTQGEGPRIGAPKWTVGTRWREEQEVLIEGRVRGLEEFSGEVPIRVQRSLVDVLEVSEVAPEGTPRSRTIDVKEARENVQWGPKSAPSIEAVAGQQYVATFDGA